MRANLMGYIRKTKDGNALKVSISAEAFNKAERYTTINGQQFVNMVANLNKIEQLIEGQKEVTGISQIIGDTE